MSAPLPPFPSRTASVMRLLLLVLGTSLAPAAVLAATKTPPAPPLDPNRIINDSYAFLKDREPQMTETEYALYEKVVPMAATQPQFALTLLEGMVGDEDSSAAFDFVLGNVYYEQKRLPEAESRLRRAVEKFPTFIRAWDNLGVLYFTDERYADAVPCFTKAITLGDMQARLYGLLAFSLLKSGSPVASEFAYMQAYTLDPANVDWIQGLLSAYLDAKQYASAETLLRKLVTLKPRETRFWMTLANVLVNESRKLDAAATLETAASLGLLDADGREVLGDLYTELELYPEAVSVYSALATTDPKLGIERLLRYANALIGESKLEPAEGILKKLESGLPESFRVPYLQAWADLGMARDDHAQALDRLRELLKLDPLNGRALLAEGEIYENAGDAERATFAYEAATEVADSAYTAYLHLANIELTAQHYDEALASVEKALAIQKSPALEEHAARIRGLVGQPR
jgi:tetratricopeptide (TPR) repeat protein